MIVYNEQKYYLLIDEAVVKPILNRALPSYIRCDGDVSTTDVAEYVKLAVSGNSNGGYTETVRTNGLDLVTCFNEERSVPAVECASGHLFDVELVSINGFLIVPRFDQFLTISTRIKRMA